MSSKISTWTWKGSNPGYTLLTVGGVTTDSQNIVPSLITRIDFSTTDADGISRLEELKSITQDSIISIIPDQGVEAGNNWTLRVSGEPTFETDPVPFYKFPVTTVSSTAGAGFGVGVGDGIALYAPTQATSFNTVSMPDTVLTTWDPSSFESRSSRWDTREGDVRKVIYKMTQAKNNISFVYNISHKICIHSPIIQAKSWTVCMKRTNYFHRHPILLKIGNRDCFTHSFAFSITGSHSHRINVSITVFLYWHSR